MPKLDDGKRFGSSTLSAAVESCMGGRLGIEGCDSSSVEYHRSLITADPNGWLGTDLSATKTSDNATQSEEPFAMNNLNREEATRVCRGHMPTAKDITELKARIKDVIEQQGSEHEADSPASKDNSVATANKDINPAFHGQD